MATPSDLVEDARLQGDGRSVGGLAPRPRKIDRHVERDAAVADHDHPIGERHCLCDVVGDEDCR